MPLGNLEVRASSGRGGLQAPPSKDPGTEIKRKTPFWWPIPPVIWEELSQDPCISQFSHSCDLISDKKQVKEGRKGYFDPSLRM